MLNAAGTATPQDLGTAAAGTSLNYSREDHVHAVPAFSGDVTNDGTAVTVAKIQGSPVSASAPGSGQVMTWDGTQWAPATNSSGGGGGANGLTYYLNQATAADAPTTGISGTPHQLGRSGEAAQTTLTSGSLTQNVWTLLAGFVSESTPIDPDVTLIPAGLWDFNVWAYGDANTNAGTSIRCRVYKYNGTTLTEIASPSSDQVINGTSAQYSLSVLVPQVTLQLTDRIYVAIEARATGSNHNVTLQFGDSTPSHVHTSLPLVGGTGLWKSVAGTLQSPASKLVDADVDAAAAIAWSKIAPSYFGSRVKIVSRDAATIQGCIDLCTDADGDHNYTVLIPPTLTQYTESLTLKGSVSLVGMTTPLNSDAVQINGVHTFAPAFTSVPANRIGFQNITFVSSSATANTINVSSATKYLSQLRFTGCIFVNPKSDTYSHIRTDDNCSLYVDNCRFETTTGGSASAGITQGNAPLYLSNNVLMDVYGRAIDVPASTTDTRTATSTIGSTTLTLTSGTTTGLSVGMKISGTNINSSASTIVSITAPSTIVMSTPPKATGSFTATFGQTPYVEIHDTVLISKGAEAIRLGNGLLTANNSNVTNTATGGSGINMLTALTVTGMVNSSFTISDTAAYVITAAAATCYAALNSISYSSSILTGYSTQIGANVAVLDYSARATSIENGGTGATTRQAAINALAGSVTANQVIAGNGTNITLRALAAADIPSLDTGKLTTGTLGVARGGTGVATITGIVKGTGTTAMVAATAGTDYVVPSGNITGTAAGLSATLAVTSGGTGVTTSTGTGANVLGTNPTLSGYTESVNALGTVGASVTLSLASSNFITATLTSGTACTFTMPTNTAGKTFVILLKQPATGTAAGFTFTGVKFPSGTSFVPALGRMDMLQFRADGTSWFANILGKDYTY